MKGWILKYRMEVIGVAAGAVAGWCYWYFIGCASGHCMITSKPLNSTLYGAMMGGLLFSAMKKSK